MSTTFHTGSAQKLCDLLRATLPPPVGGNEEDKVDLRRQGAAIRMLLFYMKLTMPVVTNRFRGANEDLSPAVLVESNSKY